MYTASLIWRIPMAAGCFALAWHLVHTFVEAFAAEGFQLHLLGMAIFTTTLLLMGAGALSPKLPKPLFDAIHETVSKHWNHWIH